MHIIAVLRDWRLCPSNQEGVVPRRWSVTTPHSVHVEHSADERDSLLGPRKAANRSIPNGWGLNSNLVTANALFLARFAIHCPHQQQNVNVAIPGRYGCTFNNHGHSIFNALRISPVDPNQLLLLVMGGGERAPAERDPIVYDETIEVLCPLGLSRPLELAGVGSQQSLPTPKGQYFALPNHNQS